MAYAPPLEPAVRTQPGRPARKPSRLPAVAAVIGGTALIGWRAAQYGNWIADDAAISFAYARNLASGLGPVAQPGLPAVEGFSNPTWTALLAIGRLVGLFDRGTLFGIPDYVLFPKALALLCCAGILVACHAAAGLITRRAWLTTLVAAAALAAVPSFVVWCFSGLENSLFALVVTGLAVLAFRAVVLGKLLSPKVAVGAGLLAAAAALTRPDGMIYALAYPLIVLVTLRRATLGRGVRHLLLSSAAFAVPFGGYLLWRYLEFGRLVANTAVSKRQGLPEIQDLTRAGDLVQYAGAPAVLVLMVIVGIAIARSPLSRDGLIALLVVLGLAVLAYTIINADWMAQYRFATPVWALAAVLGAIALTEALRAVGTRAKIVLSVALAAALLPSGVALAAAGGKFRDTPTLPMCFIADRFGRAFNQYADMLGIRHGSILQPDLGGSSLTSRLPIVDLAGLVDKTVADFYHDNDMAALRDYVFTDVKPTFVHFRMYWGPFTGLGADPRLAEDYVPIYTYPSPDEFGGDFVRKDALTDPERLAAVRTYAATMVPAVETHIYAWPRRSCGDVLRPGQTNVAIP